MNLKHAIVVLQNMSYQTSTSRPRYATFTTKEDVKPPKPTNPHQLRDEHEIKSNPQPQPYNMSHRDLAIKRQDEKKAGETKTNEPPPQLQLPLSQPEFINRSCKQIVSRHDRTQVLARNKYVCVYVYGTNCPPCKLISPMYNKLASKYQGVFMLAKENHSLSLTRKEIRYKGIPFFVFYKNGNIVKLNDGTVVAYTGREGFNSVEPQIHVLLGMTG